MCIQDAVDLAAIEDAELGPSRVESQRHGELALGRDDITNLVDVGGRPGVDREQRDGVRASLHVRKYEHVVLGVVDMIH